MAEEFAFDITQQLGVVVSGKGGWATELNMVSWNGREPKYDIRPWSPDHQKMGKGITLTKEDLQSLKALLNTLSL
ncbi:MAG: YdbC family protein [Spirochaetaceae bacterium]|jgi:hypothetical protein|nr:YdbC family protein [Spirochaetaceae bacterium]